MRTRKEWTEWEESRLRTAYEKGGKIDWDYLLKKLKDRSKPQIYAKLYRMGLSSHGVWSDVDNHKILTLHREGKKIKEISTHFPSRSYDAVSQQCRILGLKQNKLWTKQEVDEIKSFAKFLNCHEIAERYNVTYCQINSLFKRHKIPRKPMAKHKSCRKLTPEQVKEIRNRWFNGESQASLCREFKTSPTNLHNIVSRTIYKDVT